MRFALLTYLLAAAGPAAAAAAARAASPPRRARVLSRPLNASLIDAVLLAPDYPYPVSGFLLGDASGLLFARALGGFNLSAGVSVASASKWVTQMVFSALLADGTLALTDTPGSLLAPPWGGPPASDARRDITLASLLSFTSGMNDTELTAPCAALGGVPGSTPASCAAALFAAQSPLPLAATRGCPSSFFYAGSHQMLAGWMAVAAARATDWNALFLARLARPLGLSAPAFYTPLSNPHPGGGLFISATDYGRVLAAYYRGDLLPPAAVAAIEADSTPEPPTCIAYAPLAPALHWHYGWGHWIECRAPGSYGAQGRWQPACDARCAHSSIGKLGAYPFVDRCAGFWALVMVANGSAATSAALGERLWPAVRAALGAASDGSPSASGVPLRSPSASRPAGTPTGTASTTTTPTTTAASASASAATAAAPSSAGASASSGASVTSTRAQQPSGDSASATAAAAASSSALPPTTPARATSADASAPPLGVDGAGPAAATSASSSLGAGAVAGAALGGTLAAAGVAAALLVAVRRARRPKEPALSHHAPSQAAAAGRLGSSSSSSRAGAAGGDGELLWSARAQHPAAGALGASNPLARSTGSGLPASRAPRS